MSWGTQGKKTTINREKGVAKGESAQRNYDQKV